MFNHSTSKPHASEFADDSYGFSQQPWARFDLNQGQTATSPPSIDTSQTNHGGDSTFNPSGMDWTPTSPEMSTSYHHGSQDANDVEMHSLNSTHQGGGGGVGRLVAHFENKGFSPFENRGYAPPLPPRPSHHAQTQQSIPRSHFDGMSFLANGSGINTSFHPNRLATPTTIPSEVQWGSFAVQARMASPVAANSQNVSFGTFQDASRMPSPGVGSMQGHFAALDDFTSPDRVQTASGPSMSSTSQMGPSPLASPTAVVSPTQASPPVSGTPGFEIWRPPGSVSIKSEMPSAPSLPSSSSYAKPPVPSTPKPNVVTQGNQFILELNPASKAKGKAPAKPARLRANPSLHAPFSPEIKQEPRTPCVSEIPTSTEVLTKQTPRQATASGRPPPAVRPSREQVPAEAWEQYKSTIRTLYLDERRPLKDVMAIMAEKYKFQATPKMYKTRFSQWGFVKNNTEEEVKRLLSMKFQRDAEGKVSEFVRNGRVVNLGTYLKRKGVTEYDLIDFELAADLPAHVKCRTPTPPPAPDYLRSPDLLRAQELVVGNIRKAFLHCRQMEVEMNSHIGWPITMVWGAGSSDLLMEANFYFEARDADQGGHFLMRAFKQLEIDLKNLSPLGINEVLLGMVQRDPGMMTALCKYLAAYSTTNWERSHPLRQIFTCLYEVQQKHGPATLSDLLWGSIPTIAEELEAIYSRKHPYVARTWIDLALFYNHTNSDRLEKLVAELRTQERQVEQRHGTNSTDALTLRYSILQLLYALGSNSDPTRQAAVDLWGQVKRLGVVFAVRDAKPNVYCYHSPVKVDPWTKRCRRRYDSGVAILEEHVGVKVHPYFEEDFHTTVHAPDAQDAWSAALNHMQSSSKWSFI
ncbi:hypothetical protein HIM_02912 [Hirsutella minnesotensis 3608]|nr:hypothetical protein HIM_02912 [Hirsutella minnesotensis 3608]